MLKLFSQCFHTRTLFEYSSTSWAPVIVFKVCVICSESPSVWYHFQLGWEVYKWWTTDLIPTRTSDCVTKDLRKYTFPIILYLVTTLIQIHTNIMTAQLMWLSMFYTWNFFKICLTIQPDFCPIWSTCYDLFVKLPPLLMEWGKKIAGLTLCLLINSYRWSMTAANIFRTLKLPWVTHSCSQEKRSHFPVPVITQSIFSKV